MNFIFSSPGIRHAVPLTAVIALCLGSPGGAAAQSAPSTTTPILHVVVIFQENVSFDHYFGTYPAAQNPPGEPTFSPAPGTPSVVGLTGPLLTVNPNSAQPQRLDRTQPVTCDMDHGYTSEQLAMNRGQMNAFIEKTSGSQCTDRSLVMNYYDGNTVTALWNYAQHFAMSDNSFGTTYGPSTPGALNLVAGQTHGATPADIANNVTNGTVISDARPTQDQCWKGNPEQTITMSGRNVGDLLNAKGVSWGWFQGGFRPTGADADGHATCDTGHQNVAGANVVDYIPHHDHSSTTRKLPIQRTHHRPQSTKSAMTGRLTTSTICRTSGLPRMRESCLQ